MVERAANLTKAGFFHGFSASLPGGDPPRRGSSADFALGRDPGALALDYAALGAAVGFDAARLYQVKQVHGTKTHLAEGDPREVVAREGDAVVARSDGAVAGVRVADCVPVLVACPSLGAAAAIHAGWRGVVRGVVPAALELLAGRGLVAAIGPSIGACCFEVSIEVGEEIASAVDDEAVIVARYGEGKAKVDLRRAVRAQLRGLGLADDAIEDVGGCSVCGRDRYHSYRRDGDESGRMLAVIVARGG